MFYISPSRAKIEGKTVLIIITEGYVCVCAKDPECREREKRKKSRVVPVLALKTLTARDSCSFRPFEIKTSFLPDDDAISTGQNRMCASYVSMSVCVCVCLCVCVCVHVYLYIHRLDARADGYRQSGFIPLVGSPRP